MEISPERKKLFTWNKNAFFVTFPGFPLFFASEILRVFGEKSIFLKRNLSQVAEIDTKV